MFDEFGGCSVTISAPDGGIYAAAFSSMGFGAAVRSALTIIQILFGAFSPRFFFYKTAQAAYSRPNRRRAHRSSQRWAPSSSRSRPPPAAQLASSWRSCVPTYPSRRQFRCVCGISTGRHVARYCINSCALLCAQRALVSWPSLGGDRRLIALFVLSGGLGVSGFFKSMSTAFGTFPEVCRTRKHALLRRLVWACSNDAWLHPNAQCPTPTRMTCVRVAIELLARGGTRFCPLPGRGQEP